MTFVSLSLEFNKYVNNFKTFILKQIGNLLLSRLNKASKPFIHEKFVPIPIRNSVLRIFVFVKKLIFLLSKFFKTTLQLATALANKIWNDFCSFISRSRWDVRNPGENIFV